MYKLHVKRKNILWHVWREVYLDMPWGEKYLKIIFLLDLKFTRKKVKIYLNRKDHNVYDVKVCKLID